MKEDMQFLAQLYNTLKLISTRGDDTVLMGQCLVALEQFIQQKEKEENDVTTARKHRCALL